MDQEDGVTLLSIVFQASSLLPDDNHVKKKKTDDKVVVRENLSRLATCLHQVKFKIFLPCSATPSVD